MRKMVRVLILFTFALSSSSAAVAVTPSAVSRPGIEPVQMVRIGLRTDPVKARVFAHGGIVVRDPQKRAPIWKKRLNPGVYFVAETSGGGKGLIYRVQIASFKSKEKATEKKEALQAILPGEKVVLVYHADRRSWRVRVGEYRSRMDTSPLIGRLRREGYNDLWVTEEGAAARGRRRIRLVDDRWNDFLTSHDRVLITPFRSGERLHVGEASYHGTLEARVDKAGNLRLINELEMEQYLRGVVPNEMGPGVYPEQEALKAQAVAARTYLVANLGQFSDDGYDLCDSPSCQVYKGAGTEHRMTDQALEETRGVILAFKGEPINAMYTSTCGGHTENGHEVFPEEKGPYLKGVTCYPEAAVEEGTISGSDWIEPVALESGVSVNEAIVLLRLQGVIRPGALDRAYLRASCPSAEAELWTTLTLGLIGKTPAVPGLDDDSLTLHEFASYLSRSLGWQEKMRLAFHESDLPYLLAFKDWESIPSEVRRPYAMLMLEGIIEPFPDDTLRPHHRPSRGLVLKMLYGVLDFYDALGRIRATYRGVDDHRLLLEVKNEVLTHTLRPDVALFRSFRDVPYPARRLTLTLGDRVIYHMAPDASVDYLKLIANPRGVSDDRYSSRYRWEERATRGELETRIDSRVDIGRLIDIEPTRRGVSGRVVELKVKGSRGVFLFRGFRIRTALGVLENLFTVDRTLLPDGQVDSFIFTGKGWGHGVGLCQVGAYGMALRGKSYEEILRHYYTGVDLVSWADLRAGGGEDGPSRGR